MSHMVHSQLNSRHHKWTFSTKSTHLRLKRENTIRGRKGQEWNRIEKGQLRPRTARVEEETNCLPVEVRAVEVLAKEWAPCRTSTRLRQWSWLKESSDHRQGIRLLQQRGRRSRWRSKTVKAKEKVVQLLPNPVKWSNTHKSSSKTRSRPKVIPSTSWTTPSRYQTWQNWTKAATISREMGTSSRSRLRNNPTSSCSCRYWAGLHQWETRITISFWTQTKQVATKEQRIPLDSSPTIRQAQRREIWRTGIKPTFCSSSFKTTTIPRTRAKEASPSPDPKPSKTPNQPEAWPISKARRMEARSKAHPDSRLIRRQILSAGRRLSSNSYRHSHSSKINNQSRRSYRRKRNKRNETTCHRQVERNHQLQEDHSSHRCCNQPHSIELATMSSY